ncbi:hypothetical protein [Pedobacter frigiditerrae]|uniref:hypothetical protein n=1 Tax=Pedobacter frigiditerrae TaxID=2530452 RepID=UPI00292FD420|nr:hypothetical protein [Pedobacter frigiditerrae]
MERNQFSLSLLSLGYRDYIASRFLLNNGYNMQGITLGSSAIEKYLKALLSTYDGVKIKTIHLDKLDETKAIFKAINHDIFNYLDERFLTILSKAYQARYYDKLDAPIVIGFFPKQFIGELDFTARLIEDSITITDSTGKIQPSIYRRAVEDKNEDLLFNNYILQNVNKKIYMESATEAFGAYIDHKRADKELVLSGINIEKAFDYDGKMWDIDIKFN